MSKDLKQIIWVFVTISLLTDGLFIYSLKTSHTKFCVSDTVQIPCTSFEYMSESILTFTVIWFVIIFAVYLLILFTRKLNYYGFYMPPVYYYPNATWFFRLIYPFILAPLSLYRFIRALKRWAMHQPDPYPTIK